MLFEYKYRGSSGVTGTAGSTKMNFAPDASRDPVWFNGTVQKHLPFREAISALHDVVVSDLRFKPKDREEYKRWAAEQEDLWVTEYMARQEAAQDKIEELRGELDTLNANQHSILADYYKAQRNYFKWLYHKNHDWWFVLDPVITVHPDRIFFECFSEDESSYGCLSCSHEVFESLGEFSCGTTNIDYSARLYDKFQKIRSYKETSLTVDPSGFEVATGHDDAYKEVKIDLPDSWVRGFLQVSSAMNLGGYECELHPLDLHNICWLLRRKKERQGPRSIRFVLKPGQPVEVVLDPWNTKLECPRSRYLGNEDLEVRIWGRRRLHVLERLLPVAKSVRVKLLGYGLPSFWIIDLGGMDFTLGLSGWTSNDWSRAGNFDLLAPRAHVSPELSEMVFTALKSDWRAKPADLANRLQLPEKDVRGALASCAQAGMAIYDLSQEVWRARELTREPIAMESLKLENPMEVKARTILEQASLQVREEQQGGLRTLAGTISIPRSKTITTSLTLDSDERVRSAVCSCNFYQQNKLRKGPCEHILAVRLAANKSQLTR